MKFIDFQAIRQTVVENRGESMSDEDVNSLCAKLVGSALRDDVDPELALLIAKLREGKIRRELEEALSNK